MAEDSFAKRVSRMSSVAGDLVKSASIVAPGLTTYGSTIPAYNEELNAVHEELNAVVAEPAKSSNNPFLAFAFADKVDMCLLTLGTLLYIGLGTLQPIMTTFFGSGMTDAGMGKTDGLVDSCVKMAYLGVAGFFGMMAATICYEVSAERQVARIKRQYIQSALRLNVGFYDTVDVGTLASDVETSCVQIRNGVGNKTGEIFKNLSLFITGYVVALTKHWKMTLIMTCAVPILGGALMVMIRSIGKSAEKSKESYTVAGSIAEEAFPAIRTVAAFGLEPNFVERFGQEIEVSLKADYAGSTAKGAGIGFVFFVIFCTFGLGWLYGGNTIKNYVISEGPLGLSHASEVITAFFCVLMSAFCLGFIGPSVSALTTGSKAVVSVKEIIEKKSEIDPLSEEGLQPNYPVEGRITFEGVRFAYPSRPERDIYQSVSFDIQPGDTVALVGPSGCGKSTVIQLIERFYDVTGGQVKVDGVPIQEYNLAWLRNHMALVSQEPRLFCDTIRNNILQGKPDASEEEMIAAAKAANAHDFITALANGYDTDVGVGGGLLSGGQKQRVAIARAILRDPAIMILDEATSALDNQSEKIVQEALDKLLESKRRTTILIAHRLTTIRNANKIIVIDNVQGKGSVVIEQGCHDELMKIPNGVYKQLVEAQTVKGADEPKQEEVKLDMGPNAMRKLSKAHSKNSMARDGSIAGGQQREVEHQAGKSAGAQSPTRKLWTMMLKRSYNLFITMVICATCNGGFQPCNGLLVSAFLSGFFTWDVTLDNRGNADNIWHTSIKLAIVYICLGAFLCVTMFGENYFSDRNGAFIISELRKETFENVLYQDMEFFDNPAFNTGFLSSVLSADCEMAKTITGLNFIMTYRMIVTLIIGIIIAFTASWKIALVVGGMWCVILPLYALQVQLTKGTSIQVGKTDEVGSPAFVFNEIMMNLKTVAAFNLQLTMEQHYHDAVQHYLNIGTRNAYITAGGTAVSECMSYFASAAAYRFGAYLLGNGELSFTLMTRAVMSIMFAGNGAGRAAGFTSDAKRARIAVQNVFTVLEREPKMDARSELGLTPNFKKDVTVEHVKFRYPGRPTVPVLNDVHFTIPAGKTVAMVGESGSGKSTIIQFLERYYDVGASDYFAEIVELHNEEQKMAARENNATPVLLEDADGMFRGRVAVGGADIQDINLKQLRAQIGMVQQEPILFDLTVAENIRYGKLDATQQEIETAARAANAHEFIKQLPEGYDTCVGKGGKLLSGGQKQRVAIARALVRNPNVLLLDEATSALDPESEVIVQKALDELLKTSTRTTLVIAHRLSTIRNADLIVVFKPEAGAGSKIVEQGTHDELMRIPNGVYANLVNIAAQAGKG
ncbi:putative multidrug resistance protein-like transporter family ATP-binding cassette domain protein [Gregarina niphandrodes]|uniref:Multidrug resistance protein-like transporter family ATP-binding cassette domain protein n=1 Tax=Gregarina niphandrodes TaxID=110365 RepID=A0A023B604_GRENI|nr:putative multidrug resistance protein-like transporter family ATP-binding cassette domain protein [Gregarina niphandrodes]EZG61984.1 putative multidrug resistance protein-like transporter family ATP-binding cassette domain protein [Gregarina niphandrodes]|eukprot:XP_011130737.1 putative multidrug resistance protein-like transporter family ATP-binding cassette domain protein [Gregarina niphandrodes]